MHWHGELSLLSDRSYVNSWQLWFNSLYPSIQWSWRGYTGFTLSWNFGQVNLTFGRVNFISHLSEGQVLENLYVEHCACRHYFFPSEWSRKYTYSKYTDIEYGLVWSMKIQKRSLKVKYTNLFRKINWEEMTNYICIATADGLAA